MKKILLSLVLSLFIFSCGDESSSEMTYILTNNTSKVIKNIYVTDYGDDVEFTGNEKLLLKEPLNIGAKKTFKFSCNDSKGYYIFFVFDGEERPSRSEGASSCCDKYTAEIRDNGGSGECE